MFWQVITQVQSPFNNFIGKQKETLRNNESSLNALH